MKPLSKELLEGCDLAKIKKAQNIIDEGRIEFYFPGEDRIVFDVEGNHDDYRLGIDLDTMYGKCSCEDDHYSPEKHNCKHFVAGLFMIRDVMRGKA